MKPIHILYNETDHFEALFFEGNAENELDYISSKLPTGEVEHVNLEED
jgi:hypothetical protein